MQIEVIRDFMVVLCQMLVRKLGRAMWMIFTPDWKEIGEEYHSVDPVLCGYEIVYYRGADIPTASLHLLVCRNKKEELCLLAFTDSQRKTEIRLQLKTNDSINFEEIYHVAEKAYKLIKGETKM